VKNGAGIGTMEGGRWLLDQGNQQVNVWSGWWGGGVTQVVPVA